MKTLIVYHVAAIAAFLLIASGCSSKDEAKSALGPTEESTGQKNVTIYVAGMNTTLKIL